MKVRPGVMRVTGGELAGRALQAPLGKQTRPTSARARRGIFDWLAPVVDQSRVLDVFAGTGALGIEALSRGAAHATFVENEHRALRSLRRNLETLGLTGHTEVVGLDAQRALERLLSRGEKYDLVLVDPPYADDWKALIQRVDLARLLRPESVLVVECRSRGQADSENAQVLDGLHRISSRRYGQTTFEGYELAEPGSHRDQEEGESDG